MLFRYHFHMALTVRPALGKKDHLPFGGETEHPYVGEVFFAGDADPSHACRWINPPTALRTVTAATPQTGIWRGVIDNIDTKAISA